MGRRPLVERVQVKAEGGREDERGGGQTILGGRERRDRILGEAVGGRQR